MSDECLCLKHCFRRCLCKAIDGFANRKASMTLVSFLVVLIIVHTAGKFPVIAANLPVILGTIVALLTAFLGGHVFDSKWSPTAPPEPPKVEKKDIPAVAKAVAKDVIKQVKEGQEESSQNSNK